MIWIRKILHAQIIKPKKNIFQCYFCVWTEVILFSPIHRSYLNKWFIKHWIIYYFVPSNDFLLYFFCSKKILCTIAVVRHQRNVWFFKKYLYECITCYMLHKPFHYCHRHILVLVLCHPFLPATYRRKKQNIKMGLMIHPVLF